VVWWRPSTPSVKAGTELDAPTLLSALVKRRHLKYESFRDEYRKTAIDVAPHDRAPSRAQYYRWLSGQLKGGTPYPDACRVLEAMFPPWTAADLFGPYSADRHITGDAPAAVSGLLLDSAPGSFPASALAGPWVTCYQFMHHGETPRCHADIAHITALSDRRIWAVNWPPEPRSEGRARPFRNEIEAQLAGRHLVGMWRNTSDTRYFGAVQLAVLPGETAMEGHFLGVGSDVHVSTGHWKWARLDPGDAANGSLASVALRDPVQLYRLVIERSPYDPPLSLPDIAEDTR
jgi:hypothetical protein